MNGSGTTYEDVGLRVFIDNLDIVSIVAAESSWW
jgi:hypothetical protein